MGISGLLPALKSIHVTKHLSEYAGKTIAVDAYVWLHRGLYSCATDLATGKNTHKYVDYAMHRVRLLKHYKIHPYIVFDGGPLPAKKGTEKDRKQKRDENLSRGHALAAQGKHSQARDCYIKCVDVTPQMAFQFIKALRAEGVAYVVAPYEADAQLAYLEKTGLVDAVLTEDSDLLVFGCKTVLYKFDAVANTVVSISRDQFGTVTSSSSDANAISLYGWSDTQFRAMAILSGCDYLPSIPGVGLKTACNLLRKWKSAEQVVRAIAMEGKKNIPNGYWKDFQLAEKCFLHQRVYCPLQEKLVHLTEVGGDWNEEFNAYVGGDLDPGLAKRIALGDACPVSLLPMSDINSGYVPRVLKPIPPVSVSPSKLNKGKGKMRESLPTGGILNFFGANPIIPPRAKASTVPMVVKTNLTGKASGKRTLAEIMDNDIERKKKHRKSPSPLKASQPKQSKFFSGQSRTGGVQRRHSEGGIGMGPVASSSRAYVPKENKENEYIMVDDDDEVETSEPDMDGSDLSMKVQYDLANVKVEMTLQVDEFPDVVEQEEGYISPSPSCSKDVQDLSSPARSTDGIQREEMDPSAMILSDDDDQDQDFGVDAISSPISERRPNVHPRPAQRYETPTSRKNGFQDVGAKNGAILVEPTPTPTKGIYPDVDDVPSPTLYRGPDLRNILGEDSSTDLETSFIGRNKLRRGLDDGSIELASDSRSGSVSPPSPSPETPASRDPFVGSNVMQSVKVVIDVDAFDDVGLDDEEDQRKEVESRSKAVMDGWRQKWALPPKMKNTVQQTPVLVGKRGRIIKTSPRRTQAGSKRTLPTVARITPGPGATRALRRSETNVTPAGRHSLSIFYHPPKSAPSKMDAVGALAAGGSTVSSVRSAGMPRKTLAFFETVGTGTKHRTKEFVDLSVGDNCL